MEIECKFVTSRWDKKHDQKYFCIVNSVKFVTNAAIKITSGNHLTGKSDDDVEAVQIESKSLDRFPRGLHKLFTNMTGLKVEKCGLKSITRRDLIGLENLTDLYLQKNQLTALPSDLFADMHRLKNFSFRENQVESVGQLLFAPILKNELNFVDFRENKLVDSFYGVSLSKCPNTTLEQLITLIKERCAEPSKQNVTFTENIMKGFAALWISGRLSDFAIIVESKKFKVHKSILAIQSSVFAQMFEDKTEKKEIYQLNIQDFSARTVEEFLRFIYTGHVEDYANAIELFAISSKYKVGDMSEICSEILIAQLNSSNAFTIFDLSHQFNSDPRSTTLRKAAFEEIKLMFTGNYLDESLIHQPEHVKELVDAKFLCDSLLQKACSSGSRLEGDKK